MQVIRKIMKKHNRETLPLSNEQLMDALTEIEKSDLINQIDSVERRVYGDKDALSGVEDKRLFSILQNSSKIVDANGEPMVVYRGTPNKFTTFDKEKIDVIIFLIF